MKNSESLCNRMSILPVNKFLIPLLINDRLLDIMYHIYKILITQIKSSVFYLFVLTFFLFSCSNSTSQAKHIESTIQSTKSCSLNPNHKYELYIPVLSSGCKIKSFIVLIDSHGDGKFAMKNFMGAADKYGVGLVASDLIKNNDPDFLKEIDELANEIRVKYNPDAKIYLAGFSGGARMALVYALNNHIDGVIACGALAGPDQLFAIQCPVIGVVGMDDFNFMEAAQYILNPDKKPENTQLVLTNDSHAWPDQEIVSSLVGQLVLANGGFDILDVKNFVSEQKSRVKKLNKKDNVLNAACIAQNLSTVASYEQFGDFGALYHDIITSAAYKNALEELSQNINLEINMRKTLLPGFLKYDSVWWKNEIASIKKISEKGETKMEEMTYKRILGFIGIACYSMSRQFLQKQDVHNLEQTLMVYRLVEPNNEDMKRFSQELEEMKSLGK